MAGIFLSEDRLTESAVRGDTSGKQRTSQMKEESEGYIVVGMPKVVHAYMKHGSNTTGDFGGAWQP